MKDTEMLMKMNLQFFAEDDGSAENPEAADPEELETENESEGELETYSEPDGNDDSNATETGKENQTIDVNAIAAAARRKAEQESRLQMEKRDAEYAKRFSNFSNPLTGKPILSEKDYFDALDAQETISRNEMLKGAGIEPAIIDKAIMNHPALRQAQEVLNEQTKFRANMELENDFKEVTKLDPSIKTYDDIANSENGNAVLELMQSRGLNLVEAYKIANFDKLSATKSAAAQQAAINKAKGKDHLNATSGVDSQDKMSEIPQDQVKVWEKIFPDKTPAERKKLYNKSL